MNCFIHTLLKNPTIYFFTDESDIEKKILMPSSVGYIDFLSSEPLWTHVHKIFFVCGPARFTSLRNLSVFLQILQTWNGNKYSFYKYSTFDALFLLFEKSQFFLPVNTREGFLFSSDGSYIKSSFPEQGSIDIFLEDTEMTSLFFQNLLLSQNKHNTSFLHIEYGSEPNVGIK